MSGNVPEEPPDASTATAPRKAAPAPAKGASIAPEGTPAPPESADRFGTPDGDVGVILNANAGRVRRRLVREVRRVAPNATIFWTRNLEEANDALEAALESGFTALYGGGGDGTIIHLINQMLRYKRIPRLGILRLGTGNALATWAAARTVAQDLGAWERGEAFRELAMPLVVESGEFIPFAGVGWDAAVLNDYRWVKERLKGTPFEAQSQSLAFYFAGAFGRTIPRYAGADTAPVATVEILEGEAWRIDSKGNRLDSTQGPGEVLYRGPAHMLAFGSTPYYGYALKMFAHADSLASHFQLRVSSMDIATVLNELPRIWKGDLEHERLSDFLVQKVRITFSEPVPYQVAGDARGPRQELVVAMSQETVPVVSYGS